MDKDITDEELEAIVMIVRVMKILSKAQKARVIEYVTSRIEQED